MNRKEFEIQQTDKIEIATLNSAIILTDCIKQSIEDKNYKQIISYLEMQICNAEMMLRWAKSKLDEQLV